ncbi:MAG: polymer-forming cytoskeletal protein [Faecalibacterium sp.]
MKHVNGGGSPFGKFISPKKEEPKQDLLEQDQTLEKVTEVMNQKRKGYSVIEPAPTQEEVFDQSAYQAAYQTSHEESETDGQEPKPASKSIIASDVVITGNIESKGDLEILGTHLGNVKADGIVMVAGTVNGNIEAKELVLQDCTVAAEQLTVAGKVAVEGGAKVSGDITCDSIDVDAGISGNIRVRKKCTINSTAVINGDITAGSISIEEGAKIHSHIEIVTE